MGGKNKDAHVEYHLQVWWRMRWAHVDESSLECQER